MYMLMAVFLDHQVLLGNRPNIQVGYHPHVCSRRTFSLNHKEGHCTGTVIDFKCDIVGYQRSITMRRGRGPDSLFKGQDAIPSLVCLTVEFVPAVQ